MPKGRKRTKEEYEKELTDAVKRIGKKPEALRAARTSKTWQDYLINTLNFNPEAVESDAGSKFWNGVRTEVRGISQQIEVTPRQLAEANATVYRNPKTEQVSYRGSNGRFVKAADIKAGRIIGF